MPESQEDILENLQYRLILAQNAPNDPMVKGIMLARLITGYRKNHIKMPAEVAAFVQNETSIVQDKLTSIIEHKKEQLQKRQAQKAELIRKKEHARKKKTDAKRKKSLTRTQQIFGE
ncbi:MAG: hypothetical protein ABH879_05760 [archaeon]